ncbi:MAG: EAL domain-containing protein, partial [Alphaproteobacteria bacterium]|nr:EAL domain-containing protein [Alphaproteobacteria bacterium]
MPDSTAPHSASAIRSERDRFVAFAFAAADLLFEVDGEGRIGYAAGALKSLTGSDAAELIGRAFTDLLDEGDRALAKVLLASLKDGGRLSPILVKLAAPRALNVALGGCRPPSPRESSQITITVLPARLAVDERAGARDAKTGLLEKDEFVRRAEEKLRTPGGDYRLSLVEVGGLESLREQADAELSQGFMTAVGRTLRAQSADGDSAGQIAEGRFGVVHDGGFNPEIFQRQLNELAKAADIDGVTVEANDIELSAGELSETDAARTLLYAINEFSTAKKGDFTLASLADGFRQLVADTASRVRGLRGALENKDFSIVFQPIVALAGREVHHFEVLSRFAKGGPAEMVHFAEQLGVVAEFDLAVCERAIAAITEKTTGGRRPVLAVNISGRSLESEIFAGELDTLLREHADLAPHLMFEITESALITRMNDVQKLVARLRQRGFRVCLDDFGAGSSSFHYLNAFPVDFVKIDGKYVKNALDSARDRAFLKAMAQLCHDLDTATIAEMIETELQADLMKELGVGFGQGYLFGKPASTMTLPPRLTELSTTLSAKAAAAAAFIAAPR